MTMEDYFQAAKSRLSEKRYQHSVNVAKEAQKLARRYGANEEKAKVAGILHDITKQENPKAQLQTIENGGIILSTVEKQSPNLYHAISASVLLQQEFGISDPEILNAVRYHTTGRAGMSLLEKVIYLADLVSEDREYPGVEEMRRLAMVDLDDCLRESLLFLIPDLIKRNLLLHPDSVAAYNELTMKKQKKND